MISRELHNLSISRKQYTNRVHSKSSFRVILFSIIDMIISLLCTSMVRRALIVNLLCGRSGVETKPANTFKVLIILSFSKHSCVVASGYVKQLAASLLKDICSCNNTIKEHKHKQQYNFGYITFLRGILPGLSNGVTFLV